MKVGIVGLPSSGKTTLFQALIGSNFPVLFDKPNLGSVKVFDKNIQELSDYFKPKKTTFAEITFVDIPGVPVGIENSKRRSEVFTNIKNVDALIEVVDGFSGGTIEEKIYNFDSDLIILDMDVIERRIERLSKEKLDFQKEKEKRLLEKFLDTLNNSLPLRTIELSREERAIIRSFEFFTIKPILYLINIRDTDLSRKNEIKENLSGKLKNRANLVIVMPVELEKELSELGEPERSEFLQSYGLEEPALPEVIRASMELLNYHTFYTVGGDEVRAWLLERGANARTAASIIHSDIEKGFIAAEVISFEELKSVGFSLKEAKAKGLLKIEGEDYIIGENEVLHFRFNI